MFRIRLSGSIGSNDFKLAEGRYGIIEPFGKREVSGFVFTPSMAGLFNEKVHVENAQDADNNQQVTVKATVRKSYTLWVPFFLSLPHFIRSAHLLVPSLVGLHP